MEELKTKLDALLKAREEDGRKVERLCQNHEFLKGSVRRNSDALEAIQQGMHKQEIDMRLAAQELSQLRKDQTESNLKVEQAVVASNETAHSVRMAGKVLVYIVAPIIVTLLGAILFQGTPTP